MLCVDFVTDYKMFTTDAFTFQNNDYIKLTAEGIGYLKSKPSQTEMVSKLTEMFENRLAACDVLNHTQAKAQLVDNIT